MPRAQPEPRTIPIELHDWKDPDLPGGEWCAAAFEHANAWWPPFARDAGVFAFASCVGSRDGCPLWRLLYVDETEFIADALPSHPKWAEAEALGATHVVIEFLPKDHINGGGVMEWVEYYHPPLNADFNFARFCRERGYYGAPT